MNCFQLQDLTLGKFEVVPGEITDGVCLKFSGEMDMRDPTVKITPYLNKVHIKAMENKLQCVDFDFRGLRFMNSSGLKAFITFVNRLDRVEKEKQYRVRVLYTNRKPWQGRTLSVLQELQEELVEMTADD